SEAGATESIWQRSFADNADGWPMVAMFGIGACLAELTQDLKDAGNQQAFIDNLNRVFGNLRAAAQDPQGALLEPVTQKMGETLAAVAAAFPDLAPKCAD